MFTGLLLASSLAFAAQDEVTFGVAGGWVEMDTAESLQSTWTAVPRIGYGLGDVVSFEFDLGYSQGRTTTLGYVYHLATPRVNLRLAAFPNKRIHPFVVAGPGIFWRAVSRDEGTYGLAPNDQDWGNYKNPDADGLANAGVGLAVDLTSVVGLRTDARWLYSFGQEPLGGHADAYNDIELTASLTFTPAANKRDRDLDGIVDKADACPSDAEDLDGFEDMDGCPELDNDGDGFTDLEDSCPLDAEDLDGFRDTDGCPELDNDADGFTDEWDACPMEREDEDGFEDMDGCPDLDNDGDGLADLRDSCPMEPEDLDGFADFDGCPELDDDNDGIVEGDLCPTEPEVINGVMDDDGCPDSVELARFTGIIEGVNFHTGSAEITVDTYRLLDEAAGVLKQFPNLHVEVHGHTDSDGDDLSNLTLSERRAQAVVDYLVRRGVERSRLSAAGFGETKPIVTNETSFGKAVNRRVEFHIVQDGLVAG